MANSDMLKNYSEQNNTAVLLHVPFVLFRISGYRKQSFQFHLHMQDSDTYTHQMQAATHTINTFPIKLRKHTDRFAIELDILQSQLPRSSTLCSNACKIDQYLDVTKILSTIHVCRQQNKLLAVRKSITHMRNLLNVLPAQAFSCRGYLSKPTVIRGSDRRRLRSIHLRICTTVHQK